MKSENSSKSKSTRKPRERPLKVPFDEFNAAHAACMSYVENGKRADLWNHFKGQFSDSTLRNFLDSPSSGPYRYSARQFVDHAKKLSPLDDWASLAYQFIKKELGTDSMPFEHLLKFVRNYRAISNFDGGTITFAKTCRIGLIEGQKIPYYIFPYRYGPPQARGKRAIEKSDGFIFGRHGKIYFVGLSPRSTLFASFKSVDNPEEDILYGAASFSDPELKNTKYSQLVLHSKAELSEQEADNIQAHMDQPVGSMW